MTQTSRLKDTSTIQKERPHVVLINTFKVKPEHADELLAKLAHATEEVMASRPGFISANFHRALDGATVVNYAQWASEADFQAMRADPAAQEHMRECAALCESFSPQLLRVVSVHARD